MSELDVAAESARGSFILLVGNLIQALTGVVFVIVVARLLGPSGYGSYTLALLIPLTIQSLVGSGVSTGITRYAAYHVARGEPEIARRMTLNGLLFLLLVGALLTLVTYAGGAYLDQTILHRTDLGGVAGIASLAILAQTLLGSATAGLLGWRAMKGISTANVVWGVLRLGIAVPLIVVGFGVVGTVIGYVSATLLSGLLAFVILIFRLRGYGKGLPRNFAGDVGSVLSYGTPLYVGSVVTTVAGQYVVIVLALISSNAVVGVYQSALNVLIPISITSGAIAQSLFPSFAHLEGMKADVGLAFRYAVRYTAYFVAPMIFFIAGAARPLFDIIYGASFSSGIPYLVLLALANIPLVLGYGILPSLFNGVGKTRVSMVFSFVYAVLQVAFASLMAIILGLGVPGLISSILISSLGASAVGLWYSGRMLQAGVDWLKIGALALCSLLSCVVIISVEAIVSDSAVALVLDLVIFAAVYLSAVPVARGLDSLDFSRLEGVTAGAGMLRVFLKPLLDYEQLVSKVTSGRPRAP